MPCGEFVLGQAVHSRADRFADLSSTKACLEKREAREAPRFSLADVPDAHFSVRTPTFNRNIASGG